MSKQTEALKLALEALKMCRALIRINIERLVPIESPNPWFSQDVDHAITVLREALAEQPAQQQEPVALPEKMYEFVPTPEPIKWHHPECEGQCIACLIEQVVQEAYGSQGLGYLQRHLTSPPAQRKPLTDEEIWDEVKAADLDWQTGWSLDEDASNRYITFARAIEAAHGIKENT